MTARVPGPPERVARLTWRTARAPDTMVIVTGRLKGSTMFRKVLVANRGEIAIRAFRAGYELGARTVAVFPYEDRNSLHRLKADEAYEIGEPGHPVRAYLSVEEIVRAARRAGADAVYPGYGFLSENPELAKACADAGITFVGPDARILELTGNKARAVAAAREAGVPVLGSSAPSNDVDELVRAADEIGFPVFVKAVAGGGGRGMRRVEDPAQLREAVEAASREAASAFGDPTVFLEKAVVEPRHIEVQILADGEGNVIHLYERDCSVQRRHQKVIELAPAPNLDPELRDRICADAVKFARHIGYRNAGTVEFLLDREGHHVFIEMNPRIQVEHTVTEEVTDVDLVQSQLRIAAGETLADLGLSQESVTLRGAALQCRITTEDPANGFRPDTGRISAYRSPGGSGIRLDGGTTHAGTEISAHFDSMLVKLTCRGRDFATAVGRARRAVAEFRIRGVATNIPFLQAVLDDPDFQAGRVTTSFIEQRPQLLTARHSADRGTKLLTYLADVTVNKPHGERPDLIDPLTKLPEAPAAEPPAGSRQRLAELGPEGFARWLRESPTVGVTDTTFRDAHQSLLATRVRTKDLLAVAPVVAHTLPELLSLECWGGATYDVALRFLAEDPWERLAALREAVPNICLQMLLRGRNTVGYTPYPTEVTDAFVQEAAATGVDVFRIFDALNDVSQMRPAIDAVRATGTSVAEVALCYTSDLSDPSERLYTLDYYLRLAEQIVDAGAHVLAVKDMAGLLRAPAAAKLVSALRREFDLPVHLHTHDTAGGQLATYLAAIQAGADAVDGAVASMRAPPRSPRCRRWSPPPTTPSGPRASTSRRSATWSRTGRASARSTPPSRRASPPRPGASTTTRSPAASSPTCARRRSRWASATASRTSRRCTRPPTGCWAGWSRSPRRPRWSATSPCTWSARVWTRASSRRTRTASTSPTRSSASSAASSAPRPAAGRSPSVRRRCAAARSPSRRRSCPTRTGRAWPRTGARPSTGCCSPPRPGSSRRTASRSATPASWTARTSSTGCARARSTASTSNRASGC